MAIVASVVLGPRVFISGGPADVAGDVLVASGAPGSLVLPVDAPPTPTGPSATVVLSPSVVIPEEPPTTQAPAPPTTGPSSVEPEVTSTTEAPAPTTTTTVQPAPTTTTIPAPPPPTAPPRSAEPEPPPAALSATHADGEQEGMVSWYDLPGARAGVCAHRTIDRGTVVTVTNVKTGQSITCTVNDRGPYSRDDKILDLHLEDFSRLAPLKEGVFPARLDW